MMDRVSKYNIYIKLEERENEWLIIQGAKGSFDIVDEEIINTLKESEICINVLDSLEEEEKNILKNRGYITELSEEDEFEFIETISRTINSAARKNINVTMLPSYNCNFRCEYCFEQNLQKKGNKWLNAKMSFVTVDAVFEQLRKYREKGLKLENLSLFGGEPLLLSNKDIVTYICKKAKEYAIPINCISNGYDLNHYIELINEYNFTSIQITIDGIKSEHDKRRFLAGGQGTYDRIMENIDKAVNAGINIVLRTNVNKKNTLEIQKLIELYQSKGWTTKENFRYYFKSTLRCYEELGDALSDVELMKILSERYGDNVQKFKFNSIYGSIAERLQFMLEHHGFAPLRSGYCGANMGMYTIDPFGDIYPCWDVLSEADSVIGHVDVISGEFVFNKVHDCWKERTVDRIDDCKNCKYLLFCGGGCTAQAKVMNNDLNKVFCDDFPILFNEVAANICEKFIEK